MHDHETVLLVLSESESRHLLATADLGRVIVSIGALPAALPVNYRVVDGAIVFRSAAGSKLTAAVNHTVVGFEVDHIEHGTRSGWSVLVVGTSRLVTDPGEIAELDRAEIPAWLTTPLPHYVAIDIQRISGRRLTTVVP